MYFLNRLPHGARGDLQAFPIVRSDVHTEPTFVAVRYDLLVIVHVRLAKDLLSQSAKSP